MLCEVSVALLTVLLLEVPVRINTQPGSEMALSFVLSTNVNEPLNELTGLWLSLGLEQAFLSDSFRYLPVDLLRIKH